MKDCIIDTYKIEMNYIVTNLKTHTPNSLYNFQNSVECKLHLHRRRHSELVSSPNTFVLIVQLNMMTLMLE